MENKIKLGINGFGRIGKAFFRAYLSSDIEFREKFQVVAINSSYLKAENLLYMLKYDSVHGRYENRNIYLENDSLLLDGQRILLYSEYDPINLEWGKLGVDLVLECTGKLIGELKKHLEVGAKKVLVSAPSSDKTIIVGVNENTIHSSDKIISVGSCTTNAFLPLLSAFHSKVGVEQGFVTTVHAYTNDQSLLDSQHSDPRRGRAASLSIVPTSSGVNNAIAQILPALANKIAAAALRVPVPNVSLIDFSFVSAEPTTTDILHEAISDLATAYPNVISTSSELLVSIDFSHTIHSATLDTTQTTVINQKFCRIVAWYDNEWGFVQRMLEICKMLF